MRIGIGIPVGRRSLTFPKAFSAITGYCWDLNPDVGVTLGGTPRATGATPQAVTLTGTLTKAVRLLVEITTTGALGAAQFRYSATGAAPWIATGVTAAATVALSGALSGVTLNMPAGTYTAGDTYVGLTAAVADQSPTGANALQATASLQPDIYAADPTCNGHNSLEHTLTDQSLQIATSLGLRHVFAVARHPSGTTFANYHNLLSRTPFANIWQGEAGANTWRTVDNIPSTNVRDGVTTTTALSAANDWHVHEAQLNALDTSSTWMVGASAGAGSGRQWTGRWARMIGYNVPVTGQDLLDVRSQLKALYGTP